MFGAKYGAQRVERGRHASARPGGRAGDAALAQRHRHRHGGGEARIQKQLGVQQRAFRAQLRDHEQDAADRPDPRAGGRAHPPRALLQIRNAIDLARMRAAVRIFNEKTAPGADGMVSEAELQTITGFELNSGIEVD